MTTDEAARLHLYELARSTWDAKAADTLMNAIPADPQQLATKDDLAVLGSDLRAEMATLGGQLRTEMADLRGELRSEIQKSAASTIRTIVFAMIASNATLVGLVFAAVRLG